MRQSISWRTGHQLQAGSVSLDETMSTCDSLKSPDIEYVDNEASAVASLERRTCHNLYISEDANAKEGGVFKLELFLPEEYPMAAPKSSWPKIVVRKWLNIKSRSDEFHSDYAVREETMEERRKSCSDRDHYIFRKGEILPGDASFGAAENLKRPRFDSDMAAEAHDLSVSLSTQSRFCDSSGRASFQHLQHLRADSVPARW